MPQTNAKLDERRRVARGWVKDTSPSTVPDPRHVREVDFDPIKEGRKSASSSIEVFKKYLEQPARRR